MIINKQITVLLVILFFTSTIILGQVNKFNIGIEGGPSLTSLRGNDILEKYNDPVYMYSIGVSFQYNFPKLISIRTNIAFEKKGTVAKIKVYDQFGFPNGIWSLHSNFDYITIPLLARLTVGNEMKFFLNAGPYMGYLIKYTEITDAFNENPEIIKDETDKIKKIDLGLSAGIGLVFPIIEELIITIEVRSNFGLYNISTVPVSNDGTVKTNSTNFLIGVAYKFGTRINE